MNRQGQAAGAISRPRLAAIATLLVVTCGLAAFLVLGSSASTQSVSASSAAEVSQAEADHRHTQQAGLYGHRPRLRRQCQDRPGRRRLLQPRAHGQDGQPPPARPRRHLRRPDHPRRERGRDRSARAQVSDQDEGREFQTKVNNSEAKLRQGQEAGQAGD